MRQRKENGHTTKTHTENGFHKEENGVKLETTKTVYQLAETPAYWRFWNLTFVFVGIPWYGLMAYLLFQTDDDARGTMKFFNKGIVPKDQNYGLECGFDSFYDKIFDIFAISHEECWWDHIILDIVLTNAIGAYFGTIVIDKLLKRPYSWWQAMQNDKRGRKHLWTTCVWAKVLSLFCVFGFKWVLHIPSNHWINIVHLCTHGAVFFPVISEGYGNLIHGTRNWRWSVMMWICYGIDAAVSIKMGYASPLFVQWDIWGKILAGCLALITIPSFTMYFQ